MLIQDGASRTTRKLYVGINYLYRGKEGHYADDCNKSDLRSDNDNVEEGAEVQMLNHDGKNDNKGFDFSFVNICDNRSEDFESDEDSDDDKDLTLQGCSYVHALPPVYNLSPDGTNYNDDEPDNKYPEGGDVAKLTSDE